MKRMVAAAIVVFAVAACATGKVVATGPATSATVAPTPSVPAPSVDPTPATSPPSPAASAGVAWVRDGPLAAGIYRMGQWDTGCSERQPGCTSSPAHDAVRMTLTVPDGWEGIFGSIVLTDEEDAPPPDGAGLLFGRGAWLLSDPCTRAMHAIPPDIAVGPSVDDFANAIADHPLLDVTDPLDVTLAGYSGKYIDLKVPADLSKCEVYRPWDPGIFAQGPSHQWHIWILDVDGLRIVVQSTDYPETSQRHRSELQAIVDSIRIEP